MLSPGLLVAYLWEKSNSRACEGVLPPLGPSPLKPMSMDAQCVGAGLRASRRQPRRLSPSRSVDSNAESGIATFCFPNKTWQMGLFFQRTDSVWTGGCDEGLWRRETGPSIFSRAWFLVALLCKVKKSKEANGHVSCCLHRKEFIFAFTALRGRTLGPAFFIASSARVWPLMRGWGRFLSNQRFFSPPLL